ncbi:Apolipoprotein D [Pseudolycoriella hygida]|uniref:Apolipoprotein D n=1 Tax=Pseudolycoriella hygida TaxID=35572 RepID=A0A9Q0MXD0_9DIPT|nr:Apolipoprotein D [Pseudolycoriella hygida]
MWLPYSMFLSVAILTILPVVLGAKTSTCREPSGMPNFNVMRFTGLWYEYSRNYNDFEDGCDCITTDISIVNATTITASTCCQKTQISNETQTCDIGISNILANPEKKEAVFQYSRTGGKDGSTVSVVATDYENYAILNACDRISEDEERGLVWVVTRRTEVNPLQITLIDQVLRLANFDKNKIIKQKHGVDICKSNRPALGSR